MSSTSTNKSITNFTLHFLKDHAFDRAEQRLMRTVGMEPEKMMRVASMIETCKTSCREIILRFAPASGTNCQAFAAVQSRMDEFLTMLERRMSAKGTSDSEFGVTCIRDLQKEFSTLVSHIGGLLRSPGGTLHAEYDVLPVPKTSIGKVELTARVDAMFGIIRDKAHAKYCGTPQDSIVDRIVNAMALMRGIAIQRLPDSVQHTKEFRAFQEVFHLFFGKQQHSNAQEQNEMDEWMLALFINEYSHLIVKMELELQKVA